VISDLDGWWDELVDRRSIELLDELGKCNDLGQCMFTIMLAASGCMINAVDDNGHWDYDKVRKHLVEIMAIAKRGYQDLPSPPLIEE
jgi:hypothetical protein